MEKNTTIPEKITLPPTTYSTRTSEKTSDFIYALKELGFKVDSHGTESDWFYKITKINDEEVSVTISEIISVMDNSYNAQERTTFKFGKTYKSDDFMSRIWRIVKSSRARRLAKERAKSSIENNKAISEELQEIVMNAIEPVREEMKKYFKKMIWSANDTEITCEFRKVDYTAHLKIIFSPDKQIKRITILKDVLEDTYANSANQFNEKTDELIQTIQYYNSLVKMINDVLSDPK